MSFRALLDREVTIVPRVVTGQNQRGDDVIGDGDPVGPIRAARELETADERLVDRDQQARTFVYFLEPKTVAGETFTVSGYDRILDGTVELEVRGDPEVVTRRRARRVHHWEIVAYLVEG